MALATVLSLFVFGAVLVHAFWYDPSGEVSLDFFAKTNKSKVVIKAKENKENISPLSSPVYLTIPALDISAKVQQVGITKKGNMAAPNNFTDVGWYKYGATPGTAGNVVIAGHVDNGIALPAVFSNLKNLKEGDDVYLETKNGSKTRYVVIGFSTYDYYAHPQEVFNVTNNKHYLKLVTCTGEWVSNIRTHNKRLVVTAVEA